MASGPASWPPVSCSLRVTATPGMGRSVLTSAARAGEYWARGIVVRLSSSSSCCKTDLTGAQQACTQQPHSKATVQNSKTHTLCHLVSSIYTRRLKGSNISSLPGAALLAAR